MKLYNKCTVNQCTFLNLSCPIFCNWMFKYIHTYIYTRTHTVLGAISVIPVISAALDQSFRTCLGNPRVVDSIPVWSSFRELKRCPWELQKGSWAKHHSLTVLTMWQPPHSYISPTLMHVYKSCLCMWVLWTCTVTTEWKKLNFPVSFCLCWSTYWSRLNVSAPTGNIVGKKVLMLPRRWSLMTSVIHWLWHFWPLLKYLNNYCM